MEKCLEEKNRKETVKSKKSYAKLFSSQHRTVFYYLSTFTKLRQLITNSFLSKSS